MPDEFEGMPMWKRAFLTASITVEHNLDGKNPEKGE